MIWRNFSTKSVGTFSQRVIDHRRDAQLQGEVRIPNCLTFEIPLVEQKEGLFHGGWIGSGLRRGRSSNWRRRSGRGKCG